MRPGLLLAAFVTRPHLAARGAEAQPLGRMSAGMSPDSVGFTASAIYVLEESTVSVVSLPGLVFTGTFLSSGRGAGTRYPNHTFDQTIRVAGQAGLAEDNDHVIFFSAG